MGNRFTFKGFLKDLVVRLGAAATVITIFFGLATSGERIYSDFQVSLTPS